MSGFQLLRKSLAHLRYETSLISLQRSTFLLQEGQYPSGERSSPTPHFLKTAAKRNRESEGSALLNWGGSE